MSDRFYKIGNTWYPWQTAHGLYGYTKTPTIRITYISTSQATWGQPESGYGFFDGDASEPQNGSYFHTSTWGWFDADSMAKTIWLMPSECEIDDIFFENDGEISPGARLVIDPSVSIDEEDWRYLIASVRNLGWHTISEWAELGWVLSDPNTLYFGGDFSGNNIRMESVDGGGGLIDKYASYKPLFDLRGWEAGGLFIDKPRMMGICGVLTETSDSVTLIEVPKQLSVGRIEFTGSLAEGGIPESGVVEEYVPPTDYIDVNLGLRWDVDNGSWLAKTFPADDWLWAGILSQSDLTKLQNFGCVPIDNSVKYAGLIGNLQYDGINFDYEIMDMFADIDGNNPVSFDKSNFFILPRSRDDSYGTGALIQSINEFNTYIMSYKLRIRNIESEVGYLSSDKSGVNVLADTVYNLYDNNGQTITYDVSKIYILRETCQNSAAYGRAGYEYDNLKYGVLLNNSGVLAIKFYRGYITVNSVYFTLREAPEYIDVIFGLRWDNNSNDWKSVNFNYNPPDDNYWWADLLSEFDAKDVQQYGVGRLWRQEAAYYLGQSGGLLWSDDFTFEAIEVYSDLNQPVVGYDLTTLDCYKVTVSYGDLVAIRNLVKDTTNLKFWKCRITRKPAPVLPTVSTENDFGNYNWLDILYPPPRNISPGISSSLPLNYLNQRVPYDQDKSYGILVWQASPGTNSGRTEFAILNRNGSIYAINVSQSSQTIYSARVAVCSSNAAEIVTVYDNQNTPFNAFKYTANGTDYYYYVLDKTQTDWADDLSSIGYSLTPAATTCFFNQNGSKTNKSLSYLSQYYLYLNNGDMIPYSSSASLLGVYAADGTQVSGTFELINGFNPSGYLAIKCTSGNVTAAYCEILMGS